VWSDQKILEKYQLLSRLGHSSRLEVSELLGRGFADLGFEVFVLLPGGKLLSLFTGSTSTLPDAEAPDRANFFAILSADQIVDALVELGVTIESLTFCDQREWCLQLKLANSLESELYYAKELEEVLLDALIGFYQKEQ